MLKVGLTGSIAVGKSYVCEVLRGSGIDVLDADQTSRDVVAKGTEGLARIVEEFGSEVLTSDGSLDRAKLGAIVFGDEAKRLKLNAVVHPLVMQAQDAWLREREASDPEGIAVIDAALMIESGGYKRFDKLVVVWCDEEVQKDRLMKRNELSEVEALKRINSQMPQDEKKSYADFLIDTSAGFESTRAQVEALIAELRASKF